MKWICPKCNQEIKCNRERHLSYCHGQGKRRSIPKKFHSAGGWLIGKTYEEAYGEERAKEIKIKATKSKIENGTLYSWDKVSPENKKLQSERAKINIQKRYTSGWDPKAGRAPKYKYKDFTVDGSWELAFCEWADKNNIRFERNKNRFDYIDESDQHRKYKPDFLLEEDNIYVEIKGYETERDRHKWKDFPHNLIVLKRPEIKMIKKGLFTKGDLFKHKWGDAVIGSGADC